MFRFFSSIRRIRVPMGCTLLLISLGILTRACVPEVPAKPRPAATKTSAPKKDDPPVDPAAGEVPKKDETNPEGAAAGGDASAECKKRKINLGANDTCVHPLTQELVKKCQELTKTASKPQGSDSCKTNRWAKTVFNSVLAKLGGSPGTTVIPNPPLPQPL